MSEVVARESAEFAGDAARVYALLADYDVGHPSILPPRYFTHLVVERGGRGEGTVIRYGVRLAGRVQEARAEVSEPEPGRVLCERILDVRGTRTTFVVDAAGPGRVRVTIATAWRASGLRGLVERLFAPSMLRRIYREQLALIARTAAVAALLAGGSAPLVAQTDYYNTDRDRPVRIEDAYTTERYAFELKLAPVRLERERGVYTWSIEPEIAYGVLPRTSVEVGVPFAVVDGAAGRTSGVAGLELTAFHNLNVETRTLPALGLRADVVLPVGSLADDEVRSSLTAIATRTLTWLRFHVNAQYTFGPDPEAAHVAAHETSRWLAGLAVDRTAPLRALLVTADVFARQPIAEEDGVEWHTGAGLRYQVNPYLAVDAGLGRRLTGAPAWYVTFGSALHFGIRSLMPR